MPSTRVFDALFWKPLAKIDVDPQTFAVKVDGVHATAPAPKTIALNQLYFFS
jgi:urease subunit alpha